MQIRCHIQLGQTAKKLVLVSQETETLDHMALKLAAFIYFFDQNPQVAISGNHPAVADQEFRPDLIALDEAGATKLWVECGNVATHKLDKLIRRNRNARLAVFKGSVREGKNQREAFEKNDVPNSERVEIFVFPESEFEAWKGAMSEAVEIYGEPSGMGFNLVANGVAFGFDFIKV
ncbi:MAG: hypothetical protein A2901_07470 [Elusimicrobia bacterium RIFCSPLOWO2_01_FULL_54_10]|nr:MAG: hypothetical protein A2901_07470 [Elusimicrobia bacterium RIFCSPLOWO2_01_FULL_54_10]